jgi:hypothetical protein
MTSTPSNFSNSPAHRPSLQVVPPAKLQPTTPTVDSTPNLPLVMTEAEASASPRERQWPVIGAVIIGLGCLGFIPVDLDKLNNQFLSAGSKILEIVDLQQLTVAVLVKPEDAPLVHIGDKVTFRPQGTVSSYTGTVQSKNDIDSLVQSDGVQHPPMVAVRVSLNHQRDNLLRPGLPGYAHIETKSLWLYQKLQREFVKLVPVGKFF